MFSANILNRNSPSAPAVVTINNKNRCCTPFAVQDDGVVASISDARHQARHEFGRCLVNSGSNELDRLAVRVTVFPHVHGGTVGAPKADLPFLRKSHTSTSQQNSCNGYRSTHKPLPPMTGYLGTFEGERKRNTRGFDEDCSIARALSSLLAITVFLYAVSLFARVY